MFSVLKCDLKKSVVNIGFAAAVITAVILCFTSSAYADSRSGKTYSVFEAVFILDEIADDFTVSSIIIFDKALSGYIGLFMPVIAAFPFMVTFCSERNSGFMRFSVIHSGKNKYYFSKFLSVVISGGLSVTLGVLIYGIIIALIFPPISSYEISPEMLQIYIPNRTLAAAAKVLINAFIYGAAAVLPAFFISSFCNNSYIITCTPFLLKFIQETALNKIYSGFIVNGEFDKSNMLIPFYPDSLVRIMNRNTFDGVCIAAVAINAAYVFLVLAGFMIIMNKRIDKGM